MIDNVLTVAGIIAFVVLCYLAGRVLNRFRHHRFTRAWQPLVGIIGGRVHEDPQGGGASSWLAGTWKGYTIHAQMAPRVRTTEHSNHRNHFAVGVAEQDGRESWNTVEFPRMDVRSDDRALADRLRAAGVLASLQQAGSPSVRYERHTRYLFVEEDVAPLWAPPPERFVVLLDLAVELARLNAAANGVGAASATP